MWQSPDPIDRFHAESPTIGLNLYQYSLLNPVRYRDPTGLSEEDGTTSRVVQGASVSVGTQLTNDAMVRDLYTTEASKLPPGDPRSSPARSALRDQARAMSSPAGRIIAETMRPEGQPPRVGGRPNVTNPGVNRALGVAGKAGPALTVVGAGVSVYNVATAPEGQVARTVARESGVWAGAISFGAAGGAGGAKLGAVVGAAFGGVGAVPGAAIGGFVGAVGGGIIGAFAGAQAGENVYDAVNRPP